MRMHGRLGAGVALAAGIASTLAAATTYLYWRYFRVPGEVDRDPKKHGGLLVANVLKEHGVKFIFTLVGGHISPILVACEQIGIRVIDTRHEVTTVFAADAVARLTGIPGVCAVTAGPGLTNTVTAVKNAQMAESPLILIGGAAATLLKGRGALQDIDQMALFKPICKFCATITKLSDIVPTLRKAFQIAQSGVPGPVFIEFPIDTLYPYDLVLKEAVKVDVTKQRSLGQRVVDWYLVNHVNRQFAGAFVPQDCSPLPVQIHYVPLSQIKQAAKLIRAAKRPVLVLGSQATLPPVQGEVLAAALESLGIPCFLGGMSRGLLGKKHPLHIRQNRGEALKDADVVILAGAVCDFRLSYGRVLNRKSHVIAVNRDRVSLTKNTDIFWKCEVPALGDVGTFLLQLSEMLADYKAPRDWLAQLQASDEKKEASNKGKGAEGLVGGLINPVTLLHHVETVLDEDSFLIADGGDFVGTAAYILRPRGPLRWLDPGAFGTLGVGAGFALAAKLCHPESEVWIIYGDGSLGYSVAEFDTFTRHKVPVIALVGNDACWSQIAREQVPMFNSAVACNLAYCDYHHVAEGYGGVGLELKATEKIDEVLALAKTEARKGHPCLINVHICKTDFRAGSISV